MNVKRLAASAILGLSMLILASGCGVRLVAQAQPTSPPTRTPRPTFTPRPEATDTPVPTDTPQATDTAEPTNTPVPPTAKPVVKAPTAKPVVKPPTAPPAPPQPTAIPQPTKSPYLYSYISQKCEHSGGVFIQIIVYSDYHDPNSLQAGVKVRGSWTPDGGPLGDTDLVTDAYGMGQYTLQTTLPAKVATYYAWVIDKNKNRISDISAPININNGNEDDPNACQLAKVFFAAGKN